MRSWICSSSALRCDAHAGWLEQLGTILHRDARDGDRRVLVQVDSPGNSKTPA